MNNTVRPMNSDAFADPIEVQGWACCGHSDGGPPAVIVNPQASALTLLSWSLGQLQQCNAMMDAIGCMSGCGLQDSPAQAVNFVRQFSAQAETVLLAGVQRLLRERMAQRG